MQSNVTNIPNATGGGFTAYAPGQGPTANAGATTQPAPVTATLDTNPTSNTYGLNLPSAPVIPQPSQQPAKPVTAFSSDTANEYASDNTQKLQTLKNTGLTVGQDGLARYSDSSFATAPMDAVQDPNSGMWTSGGVNYAIGPATSADPELTAIQKQISDMKSQFDATSQSMINNIKSQFDNLITKQTDDNTRSQASLDQTLLMGGTSRYAQLSSTGQSASMMSYGLQQIADLNTKEQSAVIQAQQAQEAGDMKLMDSALTIAQKARDEKQAAAQTLSDKLTKQADIVTANKQQAAKDTAVQGLLSQGITDPNEILKSLQASGNTDITAKDIADTVANLNPNAKEIVNVLGDASKFGAPPDVLTAIGNAKTLTEAYKAAGKYLTDPTSNVGMYNAYVARTTSAGQTPVSAEKFLATQDYNKAYNAKAAGNAADAAFADSDKGQQKLEQDYRAILVKELSNRSGGLGLQDAKVNQAIHLKALVDQFKDPTTGDYNIPTSQYYELAIGLASLVSGTNTTSDSDRKEIAAKTASGDLRGALQYITGSPQNGNTQEMIKNLIGSIDRQGQVAEDLRNTDVQFLRGLAPTDLSQERKDALEKNLLPSYRNPPQDPLSVATQDESLAASAIKAYDAQSPENQQRVDDLHAKFPYASALDIATALGINQPH